MEYIQVGIFLEILNRAFLHLHFQERTYKNTAQLKLEYFRSSLVFD